MEEKLRMSKLARKIHRRKEEKVMTTVFFYNYLVGVNDKGCPYNVPEMVQTGIFSFCRVSHQGILLNE